jgi:hypothetical protein
VPTLPRRAIHSTPTSSYVYAAAAVVRIIAAGVVAKLSKRYSDRALISGLEVLNVLFLALLLVPSNMTNRALPMPLFVAVISGILAVDPGPPVLSLYSKLIGAGNAGLYFAVLQSVSNSELGMRRGEHINTPPSSRPPLLMNTF